MAKLEENYLSLLRDQFYNTTDVKHTQSDAPSKSKNQKTTGDINVKLKTNLKAKLVRNSHDAEPESEILIENNARIVENISSSSSGNKKRKISSSLSDTSDIIIKQKEQTAVINTVSTTENSSNKKERKNKVKSEDGWSILNPSHNTKSNVDKIIKVNDRKEKVLKKPRVHKISREWIGEKTEPLEKNKFNIPIADMADFTTENASDVYDNEKVSVKGLKFKAFCNLFPSTCNEHLETVGKPFTIPIKHFQHLKADDIEWGIDKEVNARSNNRNKIVQNNERSKINKTYILDNEENSLLENYDVDSQQPVLTPNKENTDLGVDESPSNEETYPARIINLKNGSKIIILPHVNQMVHFTGFSYLKVLFGEVEILGAHLSTDSEEQKVYSPRGTSLLYIRNKSKSDKSSKVALKEIVSEELLAAHNTHLSFEQHCAILLCRQLNEPFIQFIENHISQKIFPELNNQEPRIDFELSGQWNKIQVSEVWQDVLEKVHEGTKAVICGGKSTGKSTFLRYAINVLLTKFKKLRVMDLDPGQSEFGPPGCIHVATVDFNVLGPNYTHFPPQTNRSILSHINVGYSMTQYLKSIKELATLEEDTEKLPTLINFPGYTQDLGINIAACAFELLQPTLVIEIKHRNDSRNYKVDMTPENVNDILKSNDLLEPKGAASNLSYDFEKLPSLSCFNKAWSLEARQAREICILSYFGAIMTETVADLLHPSLDLFSINLSAITIISFDRKTISPLAINGNLVALCSSIPGEPDLLNSHGYGIVRGIDIETNTLVLLTPQPIETMENVSHLVLSSVTTPPSLIMTANAVKGHIPYVGTGGLVKFSQFTKRSYLPPRM